MKSLGNIEVRIKGKVGEFQLSTDTYDIKEIVSVLQTVENLLFQSGKKDRPNISYNLEEGSVKHIFKTTLQAVIGLNAVLLQVGQNNSIDFLEAPTAKAIEELQNTARKKNYDIELSTSESDKVLLKLDSSTNYYRTDNLWVETELYFYGTLTNAGGKNKANIHLDTDEFGSVTIQTDKNYLKGKKENLLYKKLGVRAIGLQRIDNGEIDKSTFKLIDLIDYNPKFDKAYLSGLVNKASQSWKSISDADECLSEIRGGYEA